MIPRSKAPDATLVDRRTAILGAAAATFVASGTAMARSAKIVDAFDPTWLPAWQIRDAIVAGKTSAVAVTDHFLARIARLDKVLHAFRDVQPELARAQARAADAALARGESPGPLFGVPVAIKEHIYVKGLTRVESSGHGLQQEGTKLVGTEDAISVERLRAAGAIIIGTTVMPGMGIGAGMPDLMMHPRNPWNPALVPGSSSAGSAAAVASAMVPLAMGGDGGGSTRLPSALCGVIGIHPTTGRVPDVSYDRDHFRLLTGTFGPISRNVRDIAITLKVISKPDGRDMLSTLHPAAPDYLANIAEPVQGLRIGWTDDFGFASAYFNAESPAIVASVHEAALRLREVGATVERSDIKAESFWPHVATSMGFYDGEKQDPAAVREALQVRSRNRAIFDSELEKFDFLASPTAVFTAPTVEQWNQNWHKLSYVPFYTATTFMFNWIMLPAISLPVGFLDGKPIGMQLVGKPDSEPKMLQIAEAFMARFPQNTRPQIS